MIRKLDTKMEYVEISVLGNKKAECLDFEAGKKLNLKINELVDAVNVLQTKVNKMAQNLNFAQPEVKENVQDPYNEQRWVGCLCKLWTGDGLVRYGILRGVALNRKKTNYPYQALSTSFEHCEPVKPNDDIIYQKD